MHLKLNRVRLSWDSRAINGGTIVINNDLQNWETKSNEMDGTNGRLNFVGGWSGKSPFN